jgi:hypothetical protein
MQIIQEDGEAASPNAHSNVKLKTLFDYNIKLRTILTPPIQHLHVNGFL